MKKGGLPIFRGKMKPCRLAGITYKPAHFILLELSCFYKSVKRRGRKGGRNQMGIGQEKIKGEPVHQTQTIGR